MLYEARRRIGNAIVLDDGRDGQDGSVWIEAASEDSVVDTVARDLVRGHRTRSTSDLFVEAFYGLRSGVAPREQGSRGVRVGARTTERHSTAM